MQVLPQTVAAIMSAGSAPLRWHNCSINRSTAKSPPAVRSSDAGQLLAAAQVEEGDDNTGGTHVDGQAEGAAGGGQGGPGVDGDGPAEPAQARLDGVNQGGRHQGDGDVRRQAQLAGEPEALLQLLLGELLAVGGGGRRRLGQHLDGALATVAPGAAGRLHADAGARQGDVQRRAGGAEEAAAGSLNAAQTHASTTSPRRSAMTFLATATASWASRP